MEEGRVESGRHQQPGMGRGAVLGRRLAPLRSRAPGTHGAASAVRLICGSRAVGEAMDVGASGGGLLL